MDGSQGTADTLKSIRKAFVVAGCALFLFAACNPFAPKLDDSTGTVRFGDPHTIEGYFQSFRYAYQFKDTTLYGNLLASNFVFSYRNYDRGVDVEWGRDEEVRTTSALFQAAQSLDVLWGNILDSTGTPTSIEITRSFALDISFNPGDISHVDGRAIFRLERPTAADQWRATRWRDESNL
jgi:hypothetical protein